MPAQPSIPFIRKLSTEQEQLTRDLNSLITKITEGKFHWASLQINLNTHAKEHTDSNKDGPSLVMSGGDHTGGEFYVRSNADAEQQTQNINGIPVITNGRLRHGHLPYEGSRCSIVAFTHSSLWHTSDADKQRL